MSTFPVSEHASWVGALDWNLQDFHGLYCPRGGSYNAYLVRGAKAALIDSVYTPFAGQLLQHLKELVDPAEISYIVANHAEIDHSGALPQLLTAASEAAVVCTARCRDMLMACHQVPAARFQVVKDGDTLDLGGATLRFYEVPLVHWPETMFTYLVEDQALFPCDFLGAQVAALPFFADQVPGVLNEARDYYTFLMRAYAKAALTGVARVRELAPRVIAPSHGPIWRDGGEDILAAYERWSANPEQNLVVVAYASLWGGTEAMAQAVADGAGESGATVKLYRLGACPVSRVLGDILEAKAVALGTPTFVGGIHPALAWFLPFLSMIRPQGKRGLTFGTAGWAGGGARKLWKELQGLGLNLLEDVPESRFVPGPAETERLRGLGRKLAQG
ncbi:MAG TPA: FprA family A-type flavoprotein [Firmicutes bacterium]|nr:FprA family A-type flavoprotein [Bacillota bacterium]